MTQLFKNSFFVLTSSLIGGPLPPQPTPHYIFISRIGPYELKENSLDKELIRTSFYYASATIKVYPTLIIKTIDNRTLKAYTGELQETEAWHEYETIWKIPIYRYLTKDGLKIVTELRDINERLLMSTDVDIYWCNLLLMMIKIITKHQTLI